MRVRGQQFSVSGLVRVSAPCLVGIVTSAGIDAELRTSAEETVEKGLPVGPERESDSPADVVDKLADGSLPRLRFAIESITDRQELVHQEREQVQEQEVEAEVFLAMAEVVLEMVTVVLERVEGLIFDACTVAASYRQVRRIAFGWLDVGHPSVVVAGFPPAEGF